MAIHVGLRVQQPAYAGRETKGGAEGFGTTADCFQYANAGAEGDQNNLIRRRGRLPSGCIHFPGPVRPMELELKPGRRFLSGFELRTAKNFAARRLAPRRSGVVLWFRHLAGQENDSCTLSATSNGKMLRQLYPVFASRNAGLPGSAALKPRSNCVRPLPLQDDGLRTFRFSLPDPGHATGWDRT